MAGSSSDIRMILRTSGPGIAPPPSNPPTVLPETRRRRWDAYYFGYIQATYFTRQPAVGTIVITCRLAYYSAYSIVLIAIYSMQCIALVQINMHMLVAVVPESFICNVFPILSIRPSLYMKVDLSSHNRWSGNLHP